MQDQQVTERRREIARAVADLSEQHQLPMPMTLQWSSTGGVQLRMDDNDRDGVVRWAAALETGAVTTSEPMDNNGSPLVSVRSESWYFRGPTWMNLHHVDIWAACDVLPAGDQA